MNFSTFDFIFILTNNKIITEHEAKIKIGYKIEAFIENRIYQIN